MSEHIRLGVKRSQQPVKAVGTNVIARIITKDAVGQALHALEVVGEGVPVTSGVWIAPMLVEVMS